MPICVFKRRSLPLAQISYVHEKAFRTVFFCTNLTENTDFYHVFGDLYTEYVMECIQMYKRDLYGRGKYMQIVCLTVVKQGTVV